MVNSGNCRATILTVGLTHEPLIYSLQQINPDYAAVVLPVPCVATESVTLRDVAKRKLWFLQAGDSS